MCLAAIYIYESFFCYLFKSSTLPRKRVDPLRGYNVRIFYSFKGVHLVGPGELQVFLRGFFTFLFRYNFVIFVETLESEWQSWNSRTQSFRSIRATKQKWTSAQIFKPTFCFSKTSELRCSAKFCVHKTNTKLKNWVTFK